MEDNKLDPKIRALGKLAGINWSSIKFEYQEDEVIGIAIEPIITDQKQHYTDKPIFPIERFSKLEYFRISSYDIIVNFDYEISIRVMDIRNMIGSNIDLSRVIDLEVLKLYGYTYKLSKLGFHPKLHKLATQKKFLDPIDFNLLPNLKELFINCEGEEINFVERMGEIEGLEKLFLINGKFDLIDLSSFTHLRAVKFEECTINKLVLPESGKLKYLYVFKVTEPPSIPKGVEFVAVLTKDRKEYTGEVPAEASYFYFNKELINKSDYRWDDIAHMYSSI